MAAPIVKGVWRHQPPSYIFQREFMGNLLMLIMTLNGPQPPTGLDWYKEAILSHETGFLRMIRIR